MSITQKTISVLHVQELRRPGHKKRKTQVVVGEKEGGRGLLGPTTTRVGFVPPSVGEVINGMYQE